jgi:hypothetical protein
MSKRMGLSPFVNCRLGTVPPPRRRHRTDQVNALAFDDLSSWPGAKHFTSWLGLAPRSPAARCSRQERAGPAAGLQPFCALPPAPSAAPTPRLAPRPRKVAVLFYYARITEWNTSIPGASSYETRYRTRVVNNLHQGIRVYSPALGAQSWCRRFLGIVFQRQRADLCVRSPRARSRHPSSTGRCPSPRSGVFARPVHFWPPVLSRKYATNGELKSHA